MVKYYLWVVDESQLIANGFNALGALFVLKSTQCLGCFVRVEISKTVMAYELWFSRYIPVSLFCVPKQTSRHLTTTLHYYKNALFLQVQMITTDNLLPGCLMFVSKCLLISMVCMHVSVDIVYNNKSDKYKDLSVITFLVHAIVSFVYWLVCTTLTWIRDHGFIWKLYVYISWPLFPTKFKFLLLLFNNVTARYYEVCKFIICAVAVLHFSSLGGSEQSCFSLLDVLARSKPSSGDVVC